MQVGKATGFQITFLSFAVALLAVPVSLYIASYLGTPDAAYDFIGRFVAFTLGALVLVAFPPLRRVVRDYLARPIPAERRIEVVVVALCSIPLAFAYTGMLALWFWTTEGSASLDHNMRPAAASEAMKQAFSAPGMLTSLLLGAVMAPLIEEILFRGLLFDAWALRWGPVVATILTSALFACYHPIFLPAFTSAVLFACVVRRTGTLWGSIPVHSFYNLMLWYPLAGQLAIPSATRAVGDLSSWGLNLACVVFVAIALPAYIVLAFVKPFPKLQEAD